MTPGARLSAAMEILDEIIAGAPAERSLTRWARASRFAGSKDRAAVRDIVFDVLRKRSSCAYASGAELETGRSLVLGFLSRHAPDDLALFTGEGHAPAPVSAVERAGLRPALEGAPEPVRLNVPPFIFDELERSLGADRQEILDALSSRAPVDLRVNTLKADLDLATQALMEDDIPVAPVPGVPTALRVLRNPRGVARSRAYRDGMVELQDAASQLVADAVGAAPGLSVLDLCAGGGGKTLALAAAMQGQGRLFAYDANPARMKDLPKRALRASASVTMLDDQELEAFGPVFDRVLADVPCSGSGAWRRNPDQKWRIKEADLRDVHRLQAQILDRAAGFVRPGGILCFATCSILESENARQVAEFLLRHPSLRLLSQRQLYPNAPGDGFFHAVLAS